MQVSSGGGPWRSLGLALFAVLFAATLVTAALVVRGKSPDLILEVTRLTQRFSPSDQGRQRARIAFFLRETEPSATVQIVAKDRELVRTLAGDVELEANEVNRFPWDGRDDQGSLAPAGRYRLRVLLPSLDRAVIFPRRIDVVRR